jgi:hypothetical protein
MVLKSHPNNGYTEGVGAGEKAPFRTGCLAVCCGVLGLVTVVPIHLVALY